MRRVSREAFEAGVAGQHGLYVEREHVCAGLGKILKASMRPACGKKRLEARITCLDPLLRVCHHQVAIEKSVRVLPQAGNDRRPYREVGNKIPILLHGNVNQIICTDDQHRI